MASTCPSCGATLDDGAVVCRACFFVIDHGRWTADAGLPGVDEYDRAHELGDPPVGPLPVSAPGGIAGAAGNSFKLFGLPRILRGRRRR